MTFSNTSHGSRLSHIYIYILIKNLPGCLGTTKGKITLVMSDGNIMKHLISV